jgi:hypothetical protein
MIFTGQHLHLPCSVQIAVRFLTEHTDDNDPTLSPIESDKASPFSKPILCSLCGSDIL